MKQRRAAGAGCDVRLDLAPSGEVQITLEVVGEPLVD
jgi:hypothetical protein